MNGRADFAEEKTNELEIMLIIETIQNKIQP
jgi:hypothetical protein